VSFRKKSYRDIVGSIIDDISVNSAVDDTSVGSVSRTIVESVSREIAGLYEQMEVVYENGFIDTARGRALDLVTGILGLDRKSAQFATGSVTFSRRIGGENVTIMRGTRVATQGDGDTKPKLYETTGTVEIGAGELEVEVPVKAVVPGVQGMTDFETITELEMPVVGIENVINRKPTTIGTERESDDEFRERIKAFVRSRSTATSEAIRAVVLNIPGVRNVTVTEAPNEIAGEVDVIVDGLDLETEDAQDHLLVRSVIDNVRPAGIQVNIRSTEIVRLEIRIYVRLAGDSAENKLGKGINNKIRDIIGDYVNTLAIGEGLVRNKLISELFKIHEVGYVDNIEFTTKKFDAGLGGVVDDTCSRSDPKTRDLKVGECERVEVTDISVITQYTSEPSSVVFLDMDIEASLTSRNISIQKVQEQLRSILQIHLNKLKGGEDIDFTRVRNIISNYEGIAELQHLTLTAFHEDTGLVIKNSVVNINTHEHERGRIRKINITII
jgi:uncharacterized phage protein gp47/JayE